MTDTQPEATDSSQILRTRVKQLREERQMSGLELEESLGMYSDRSRGTMVSIVERGRRKLDDLRLLFGLAAALEVSPLVLLLPEDGDELIELFPGHAPVRARDAYAWFIGARSLPVDASGAETDTETEISYQTARAKLHQLLPYINDITAKVAGIDVDSANVYELVQRIKPKHRKDMP